MGPKANSKSSKGSKQNGNKANGGKLQSQDTQAGSEHNGESSTDYSLLRKSIPLNPYGASQIAKAYQSGSAEMLFLLDHECEVILECRACRNLFRSLANYISHKRVYCREFYSDKKRVFPPDHMLLEDKTTVIQPEAVGPSGRGETWVTSDIVPVATEGSSKPVIETSVPPIVTYKNPKKDLSQIVEKLSQQRGVKTVTETVAHISASKFYEGVSDRLAMQKDASKEHVIRLEAMENTKYGVFQTVLQSSSAVQMENTDLMKAQVVELHNMMSCNEATLGPDGRVAVINGEGTTDLAVTSSSGGNDSTVIKKQTSSPNNKSSSKEDHVCTICNTRFSTRKTLSHHMKSLHVTFRMCYPCPCCKNTFCNTWSVYRHLYKVHRKTTLQVRKLRSQIVNKAFRKEVPEENQSGSGKSNVPVQTEADRARKEQQRLHQENQAWMNNFEDDLELQMCGGCGRRFERRAALNSHSQICQKRIAVQNNIKTRRPSPSNTAPTTSNRISSAKVSPPSTDWQNMTHTDSSKQDNISADNNTNRLTPLSVQSESSGLKYIITPSPSPVPHDQFLTTSPSSTFHRTRHCSGSSVAKKEVPEKRIEIQIRRDYCKSGTSTGSVSSTSAGGGSLGHHQDSNSESIENPLSVDAGQDDEVSEDSKTYQSRDLGTGILKRDTDNPVLNVCRYPGRRTEIPETADDIVDCDNEDIDYDDASSIRSVPDNDSGNRCDRNINNCIGSPVSDKTKTEEQDDISSKGDEINSRRTSGNSEELDLIPSLPEDHDIQSISIKKDEQFTPLMEVQMQSMINIKRLQCLPCQKKFNKLTNLRRHVAVHIGWNRYRCTQCPFKCFSKYDCVAHVNKMHLEKPDRCKAQSMVEYIETQICDNENDTIKQEVTLLHENEENNDVPQLNFQDMYSEKIKNDHFPDSIKKESLSTVSEWSVAENGENVTDNVNNDGNCSVNGKHKSQVSETEKYNFVKEVELGVGVELLPDSLEQTDPFTDKTEPDIQAKTIRGRSRKRLVSSDITDQEQSDVPTKKVATDENYQQNNATTSVENEEKPKVSETESENPETEEVEVNEDPEESPSKPQDVQQQTALRKMVLQVIFGAGNNSVTQDTETTDNMFAMAMNGEVGHSEASGSSPEPYDVVEATSSNSTSPFTSSGSTTSPASTSDDAIEILDHPSIKEESKHVKHTKTRFTPTLEMERRQRPVRNRIKVEREDFIYDLSDRCLDPKRDGEDRNKGTKRKQDIKVLADKGNCSGESSTKIVPKLMLVRTTMGEYSGMKVIKTGNGSNVSQLMDANSEKSGVGYNISTRKSQRTFDISPHKSFKQQ